MIIVATVDNLKDLRNYHQVFPQQQWKLMTIHVTGKHKNLTKKIKNRTPSFHNGTQCDQRPHSQQGYFIPYGSSSPALVCGPPVYQLNGYSVCYPPFMSVGPYRVHPAQWVCRCASHGMKGHYIHACPTAVCSSFSWVKEKILIAGR